MLTHLGHSPLFLPCRPLPVNVNCFAYSVQHQFIYTPVSACWLNQLHFVLSCNLQLTLFSNYYTKFIKIVSLTALYLIYESIKSFISCLSKTGTLKSMKSLRKEG